MGPLQILSIIHTVTIGTMLNCNGGNNRQWAKKRYVQTDLKNNLILLIRTEEFKRILN